MIGVDVRIVTGGPDLDAARELFVEYQRQIGVDLCFQNFAEELARLPGDYVAPAGTLLLAVDDDVRDDDVRGEGGTGGTGGGAAACGAAACVAMRRWDDGACEMKRLYVRPAYRGRGLARLLVERAIAWAVAQGYRRILLDTLPTMAAAQRLYEQLGFVDVAPYRPNPVEGARYMGLTVVGDPRRDG